MTDCYTRPTSKCRIGARETVVSMSVWDVNGLETNFEGFKRDRFPTLSNSDAFERFCIRQILKDADLSGEEIESGILGGGDDGGIDAMYFFVNRVLIQDQSDVPDDA